jgi:hypothetical protein
MCKCTSDQMSLPEWPLISSSCPNRGSDLTLKAAPSGLLPSDGQTEMYGPPLCHKRKTKVTVWSAQMYSAFVEHKLLALDGMRCALVLHLARRRCVVPVIVGYLLRGTRPFLLRGCRFFGGELLIGHF